jgi:hypothetical protein
MANAGSAARSAVSATSSRQARAGAVSFMTVLRLEYNDATIENAKIAEKVDFFVLPAFFVVHPL